MNVRGHSSGFAISATGVSWSQKDEVERKVLLWSRTDWRDVEVVEKLETTGSAVTGLTLVAGKLVRIVGLCIPYHFASPLGLVPRAKPWSQHERFLEDLAPLLRHWRDLGPVILAGDFNRFIPRIWGPKRSFALMETALEGYAVMTSGEIQGVNVRTIDHVAFAGDLTAIDVFGRTAQTDDGRKRSDHFGVVVDFGFGSG